MTAPWGKGQAWDPLTTFAFEQITVAATAIGPTAATVANALRGVFVVETADVRYRVDSVPTATVGMLLPVGSELTVYGNDVRNITFIRTGGVSATIDACYAR